MKGKRRGLGGAVAIAALLAVGAAGPAAAQSDQCPWMTTAKSPQERAGMLLKAMSVDDKVAMLHGSEPLMWQHYGSAGHVAGNAALCIPDLVMNDAGGGVANGKGGTTVFPPGVAQSAMWDPALARRFGDAMGTEAWSKGVDVQLAPGVNIGRVPMNGRNFEYMGEDPFLAGQTAASVIRGLQGRHVIATVKH